MFGKKKKQWQQLQDAVRQDDAEQVTNLATGLLGSSGDDKSDYYKLCTLAVECETSNALKALLKFRSGFDFTNGTGEDDKILARKLVAAAFASSNPTPLLFVLNDINYYTTASDNRLETDAFLSKDTPVDLIQKIMEQNTSFFDDCVKKVGAYSTNKLKFILTYTAKSSNPQSTLDTALVQVAGMGDTEKAQLLLDRGADPDYSCAQALLRAGEGGHQDMVDMLIPLVRLDLYGGDIAIQLEQKNAPAAVVSSIENEVSRIKLKQAIAAETEAETEAEPEEEAYKLVNSYTLAEAPQTLPDGSTLTSLFNFRSQQQQIINVPKDAKNPPGVTIISFNDISKDVIDTLQKNLDELNNKGKKKTPAPSPASPRV